MDNLIKNELFPTNLKKKDFYYELPDELIAQTPAEKRDNSRLLVLNKENGNITHNIFSDIKNYLKKGDVLVLNETKVIPARLIGKKSDTGIEMEMLLLNERSGNVWETIMYPARRGKIGTCIIFGEGILCAEITEILSDGRRLVKLIYNGNFYEILDKIGQVPLPPYIKERDNEKERYQTVYAKINGSAAAPTAGLHFTQQLLCDIEKIGVKIARVLLHVGLGTFRPVKEENITEHQMHSEYIEITAENAEIINNRTQRIIAVGTTSCRVLESVSNEEGKVHPFSGWTGIYIYPGYKFKITNALITNFHLPESTLLMLVSAFSSRDIILNAYSEAVKNKYRFFSYGDAMFLY